MSYTTVYTDRIDNVGAFRLKALITINLRGAVAFCRVPFERLVRRVNTPEATAMRFTAWSLGETATGKASGRSFGSDGIFHRTRRQDLSPQDTCREQPRGSKAH